MSNDIPRREFVADVARAAVAVQAFTIVPRHVLGRGYVAPSDTLNVACVGVGGVGASDVAGVSAEGANIAALVDVDEERAAKTFAAHPRARRYSDWREMLDKEYKTIDAVTVSTPDHSHAIVSVAALRAGKHVYTQKPLARTIGEVRAMMDEAARRPRQATQMGNQGHAGAGTRQMRELYEAGWLGKVREVHIFTNRPLWPQGIERPADVMPVPPTLNWDVWLGPAPARPYHSAYLPSKWRGWWDFGCGALGDIAPHAMDAAFWALELGTPSRVIAETTPVFPETAPLVSRITYVFPARGGHGLFRRGGGRPEVTVVWYDGNLAPGRPAELDAKAPWPRPGKETPDEMRRAIGDRGQLWIGETGKLLADIYGDYGRLLDEKQDAEWKAHPPAEKYPRVANKYREWLDAAKAGTQPGSNFAGHSGPLTQMVLLGNLAVRAGRALDLDPATGEILNTTIPNEYVTPGYREGWSLDGVKA